MGKATHAGQTVQYGYDALGRLTDVEILAGPGSGVKQKYKYDRAGNREQYDVTAPGQSPVTLAVSTPRVNITSAGGVLTVAVAGSSPGGTVTFTANGVFLGIAPVVNGQASMWERMARSLQTDSLTKNKGVGTGERVRELSIVE